MRWIAAVFIGWMIVIEMIVIATHLGRIAKDQDTALCLKAVEMGVQLRDLPQPCAITKATR